MTLHSSLSGLRTAKRRPPAAEAGQQRGVERTDEGEGDRLVEAGAEARLANAVLDRRPPVRWCVTSVRRPGSVLGTRA